MECVWKPFLLQKSVSYLITVCALPAEVLRKFYSAVWGWRREVLLNFKQHVRSNCDTEETCVRRLKHQFGQGVKRVSNLLLDAMSNNKAYGKSLAATEHKDTISDEDKQRLGNFVLCLRNARFDIVCFGSMAEEAQVELCAVFNWHQGEFCKFSWKTCLNLFWPPCVMNINEVCMEWFYGIYKPANQIYGDLQTSRISMGSNGTR